MNGKKPNSRSAMSLSHTEYRIIRECRSKKTTTTGLTYTHLRDKISRVLESGEKTKKFPGTSHLATPTTKKWQRQ